MLKQRRNQIILGLFIALIAFGVWYIFIREVEAEENKIAAPGLTQTHENPCAAPATLPDSTLEADQTAIPDDTINDPNAVPEVLAIPQVTIDRNTDEYRLYVFDKERSVINFTIAEVPSVNGTFDMFGHWFEFIYIPEEDAWCTTLWLDIDGNAVETGSEVTNNFMILAFQAEKYPVGRFVGAATELVSDLSVPNSIMMSGQIELTGVVQPLEVPIRFSITDDMLTASADFLINANDFGANLPGGGANLDSKITVVANLTDPSTIELPVFPTAVPNETNE